MAAARRHRLVAASQPGFLPLKADLDGSGQTTGRRKRVNKNKKKNWNKYSDIQDVEEFLDDVRLQERAAGGLIADKPDDSLFFVDTGNQKSVPEPGGVGKKGRNSKPLRIDLILQPDSRIAPPKDVLAHQRPNAKKERRIAQKAEKLAAMGVLPRRQKLLRRPPAAPSVKEKPVTSKDPERNFYDLWSAGGPETADLYYLEQTKKKLVKRPEKLNEKPSVLPAVEVIAPGGSYNPDFFSHQALLLEAHEVEVQKLKAEERLQRKLAINKADVATEMSTFKEQIEGLVEEEEEPNPEAEQVADAVDESVGSAAQREKKTEKQRKKEKAERMKELQKKAERKMIDSRQQLFKLRSISADVKEMAQRTRRRRVQRKARQEAQKSLPRRLGKLKFQAPDLDIQLSDEIPGSLRTLKPEGSILKDRFKSLQKRNLIEPRERAKFKRKHKLKYVEKRAFREIK
ncbi:ribosome biogenesis protein NOP53 [Pygocentrus nattereri]|nr:ribosome biogenesis protein NOP53 [Pygocentrus nattereri]